MAIVAGGPPATSHRLRSCAGRIHRRRRVGGIAFLWRPSRGLGAAGSGEVYAPSYQVSQNYFRTVNVFNTTVVNTVNITNVYNNVYVNKNVTNVTVNQRFVNMAAPNAVTAMPQNAFASGRPVQASAR